MGLRSWLRGDDLLVPPSKNELLHLGWGPPPPADGHPGFGSNQPWLWRTANSDPLELPIVASMIKFVQDGVSALPSEIVRRSDGQPMAQRPPKWLDAPNENDSFSDLVDKLVFGLFWDGNAWIVPRYDGAGRVVMLYALDNRDVSPMSSGFGRSLRSDDQQWMVRGQRMSGRQIHHVRHGVQPGSLLGTGARHSGQILFDAYAYALRWTKNFYARGATFQYMVSGDFGHQTPKETEDLKKDLLSRTGETGSWEPVLFDAKGAKIEPLSFTPEAMKHVEMLRDLANQILTNLANIPPQFYNLNDSGTQVTYTTFPALKDALWTQVHRKYARRIEHAIDQIINPAFHFRFKEETLLTGTPQDKATLATSMNGTGVFTPDEIRAVLGYGPLDEEQQNELAPKPEPEGNMDDDLDEDAPDDDEEGADDEPVGG